MKQQKKAFYTEVTVPCLAIKATVDDYTRRVLERCNYDVIARTIDGSTCIELESTTKANPICKRFVEGDYILISLSNRQIIDACNGEKLRQSILRNSILKCIVNNLLK